MACMTTIIMIVIMNTIMVVMTTTATTTILQLLPPQLLHLSFSQSTQMKTHKTGVISSEKVIFSEIVFNDISPHLLSRQKI